MKDFDDWLCIFSFCIQNVDKLGFFRRLLFVPMPGRTGWNISLVYGQFINKKKIVQRTGYNRLEPYYRRTRMIQKLQSNDTIHSLGNKTIRFWKSV